MTSKIKLKIPGFSNLVKRLSGLISGQDIEKVVFKIVAAACLAVVIITALLMAALGTRDDIEKKVAEAVIPEKPSVRSKTELAEYEEILALAKSPEGIEEYSATARRDPFSEYKGISPGFSTEQKFDFRLRSVDKVPLPMIYKGYIELADKTIGQVNWRDSTKFVEAGSLLNGYKILGVTKEKIDVVVEDGKKIEFRLNKPVLGDELRAVLYDNFSGDTFEVGVSSEIGGYKVIDIAPSYVILRVKGRDIRMEL